VDEKVIYTFGKEYLQSKQEGSQELTTKECSFCHIEKASVEIERSIYQKGYYIYEMQNC
jgi:heterodisulfide reductase subunit B